MRTPPGQVPFPGLSAVPLELSVASEGPGQGAEDPSHLSAAVDSLYLSQFVNSQWGKKDLRCCGAQLKI